MCRKGIAGFLALLLTPIIIVTVLLWTLHSTVFSQKFWQTRIESTDLIPKLITALPPLIAKGLSRAGAENDSPITADDLKMAFEQSQLENWFSNELNKILNGIFPYLRNQTDTVSVQIDIATGKKELLSALKSAIQNRIDSLPPCSPEQKPEDLSCKPTQAMVDRFVEQFMGEFQHQANSLPDKYDLGQYITEKKSAQLDNVRRFIKISGLILSVAYGVIGLLMLSIALLIFKPISSVSRWLANSLVTPAIVFGILSIATVTTNFVARFYFITLPVELRPVGAAFLEVIVGGIRNNLLVISSVLILLIIGGHVVARLSNRSPGIIALF